MTNALTISPRTGSGLATTADSATAGCSMRALSTLEGADAVAGGDDHVVGAAHEPVVAIFVLVSLVAGEVPVANI